MGGFFFRTCFSKLNRFEQIKMISTNIAVIYCSSQYTRAFPIFKILVKYKICRLSYLFVVSAFETQCCCIALAGLDPVILQPYLLTWPQGQLTMTISKNTFQQNYLHGVVQPSPPPTLVTVLVTVGNCSCIPFNQFPVLALPRPTPPCPAPPPPHPQQLPFSHQACVTGVTLLIFV